MSLGLNSYLVLEQNYIYTTSPKLNAEFLLASKLSKMPTPGPAQCPSQGQSTSPPSSPATENGQSSEYSLNTVRLLDTLLIVLAATIQLTAAALEPLNRPGEGMMDRYLRQGADEESVVVYVRARS